MHTFVTVITIIMLYTSFTAGNAIIIDIIVFCLNSHCANVLMTSSSAVGVAAAAAAAAASLLSRLLSITRLPKTQSEMHGC